MKVLISPNVSLRAVSKSVSQFGKELCDLALEMSKTMEAEQGMGLAAPQVGILSRVIVTSVGGNSILINPKVLEASKEESKFREGCLSIPGKRFVIERPARVLISYQDLAGNSHEDWFEGLKARVIQHEIDHLDGILMTDRIKS